MKVITSESDLVWLSISFGLPVNFSVSHLVLSGGIPSLRRDSFLLNKEKKRYEEDGPVRIGPLLQQRDLAPVHSFVKS